MDLGTLGSGAMIQKNHMNNHPSNSQFLNVKSTSESDKSWKMNARYLWTPLIRCVWNIWRISWICQDGNGWNVRQFWVGWCLDNVATGPDHRFVAIHRHQPQQSLAARQLWGSMQDIQSHYTSLTIFNYVCICTLKKTSIVHVIYDHICTTMYYLYNYTVVLNHDTWSPLVSFAYLYVWPIPWSLWPETCPEPQTSRLHSRLARRNTCWVKCWISSGPPPTRGSRCGMLWYWRWSPSLPVALGQHSWTQIFSNQEKAAQRPLKTSEPAKTVTGW